MTYEKAHVLIVDDEQMVCDLLCDELSEHDLLCTTAFDGHDALAKLAKETFDVVLLDIKLPSICGLEILRKVQSNQQNVAVIMITCVNDIETAVEAMKLGASDYIVKPFDLDRVASSIRTFLKTKKHSPERRDCQTPLYLGGDEEDKLAGGQSFNEMNMIALGVEVRQELLDRHSKIVTEGTIDIARELGIPGEEIQKWSNARLRLDRERNRIIQSLLDKLKRNLLAQRLFGMTGLHQYTLKPDESQN